MPTVPFAGHRPFCVFDASVSIYVWMPVNIVNIVIIVYNTLKNKLYTCLTKYIGLVLFYHSMHGLDLLAWTRITMPR